MLFQFGPRSALLLPFVVPGLAATLWLLSRALRRGTWPDALLALLILLPTLTIVQWMLGFAGWYDSHDGYSTAMFYVPWQLNLLLGPAYYLYFRSLTSQEFRLLPRARWHLLPGLLKLLLVAAAALYDLAWWRGALGRALPYHYGTKGPAAAGLDALSQPIACVVYVLLPLYAWWVLADYRRYTHYLDDNFSDPERLRFAGFRQLLLLQGLSLGLSLLFEVLDVVFRFGYTEAWNYFALRGLLIYALIAVGLQANYAAASSPLRFEPDAPPLAAGEDAGALEALALPPATLAAGAALPGLRSEPVGAVAQPANPVAAPLTPPTGPAGSVAAVVGSVAAPATPPTELAGSVAASAGSVMASAGSVAAPAGSVAAPARSAAASARSAAASESSVGPPAGPVAEAAAPPGLPPELLAWRERLLALMAAEQPWLEPELTLTELAQRLRTTPNVLSRVINAGCGQNFNDFVNTYRVQEARRKLADARYAHYSLVGVALESGFNSKSTFNRVFKKLTGQAPGEVARPVTPATK